MILQKWRSIDESPSSPASAGTIVLKGLPVSLPRSYNRILGKKGTGSLLVAAASFLWRCTAWSFSILAHLLCLVLLVSLMIREPDPREIIVEVSLARGNAGDEGKTLEKAPPKKIEEPKPEPEPEKVEPIPEEKPEKEVKPPKITKKPDPVKNEEESPSKPDTSPKSSAIGGGSGSEKPPPSNAVNVDPALIEKDATEATKARRAGDLTKLRRGSSKEIVVVSGAYDKVEKVLTLLGIPHTRVSHTQIADYDLSKCAALLVNCHTSQSKKSNSGGNLASLQREIRTLERQITSLEKSLAYAEKRKDQRRTREFERKIRAARTQKRYYERILARVLGEEVLIKKMRDFVKDGGYLFTSDWGITLLEKAFPGYLKNGGTFGPGTVEIQPKKGKSGAPLLVDVFLTPDQKGKTKAARNLRWEVDSGSYLIRTGSSRVTTLVEARKLPRHRAVVVVFSPGQKAGKVLHVLSHFTKQADGYGEFALQNLLLNFILDRMEHPR